jgi:long-chain acyl-CoA synthetase
VPAPRNNLASLVDDFERHSARHPRDLAIVAPHGLRQQRLSYGELARLARRFAAELQRREIKKGDRLLILGQNGPEWVAAFFGSVLRGVLPVPLDFAGGVQLAQSVAQEVSPKLIIGAADQLLSLGIPAIGFEDFAQVLPDQGAQAIPDLSPDDPLQIVFTSGTTGRPKGVVHTHRNVLASLGPIEGEMQKYLKYERPFHPIRFLHTLPLSHVFGQFMGLWIPPLLAAEVHYEHRLVAPELIRRIHAARISVLAAVPRVLDLIQSHLTERFPNLPGRVARAESMSAWQRWWEFRDIHALFGLKFWALICGGASLSPASEQFWGRLGLVVVQGYGMTETTALVSLNHPFRAAQGTVGQVLPGREVRLNVDGEVLVRGETISNRYWQDGRLQEQPSEWLATGDLAEFDQRGNLRFRGRKKDVIVTSAGLNIYPDDLDAALQRQPGIKTSAVIEVAGVSGPEPLAVLVLKADNPSKENDTKAALDAANRSLADFQQIRRWVVWPEPDLPRTSTGKVLKRDIAARIAAGQVTLPEQATGDLDSLSRVQLQAQLEEKYGVALDDAPAPADHIYPNWAWSPLMQAVRSVFLECIAIPLVRLLARPRVKIGMHNWALELPLLIVCNHVTMYDAPLLLYALPGRVRRRVAIAMSAELILDLRRGRNQGHWLLNLLAPLGYVLMTGLFNVFPLPQLSGFRRSFSHAGNALDRGYSVLVFPEGRRSDSGALQPFKPGAGLLWRDLGATALPVRLDGLGELKTGGRRWFRSGTISVLIGRTITLLPRESPEQSTQRLREAVQVMQI